MDFGSGTIKVLAVAVGLFMFGNWTTGRMRANVESSIRKQMPEIIGPASRYDVSVQANLFNMISGKLRGLQVHADSAYLKKKVEMETLDVNMRGVRFSVWNASFKGAESAKVDAVMRTDQLERYLSRRYTDIKDISCRLSQGKFYVVGRPEIAGFGLQVESEGSLRISPPDSICVDLDRVTVGGIKAPDFVSRFIINRLNPVIQTSDFGLKANITDVQVLEGKVKIEADMDMQQGIFR